MKVKVRLEDGTETVVDAVGEITLEYGHAVFDDGETYYDAPIEMIVSISE